MAFVIADRVQETSTTQGTGTIVLAGAITGYQSFAVIGNDNQTYYTIADQSGADWEVGVGTYYSGNVSLARTTILASSNANAAVNFGIGTKAVFVTYPAEKAIYADTNNVTFITNFASANVNITDGLINSVILTDSSLINVAIQGGTINGSTLTNVTYSGLGTMSTQNANAVAITGGTINNVSLSNVTYGGLGTMSTQNANNVAITGGTISGSNVSTSNLIATGGTIDSVVIGATTAANGSFNNLTVTGPVFANASAGTSGQVLTSGGDGANAYWSTVSGGGGSNVGIGNSSIIVMNTNITANATITEGQNGFTVGPVNTANGVTVTVASGQRWVII